MKGEGIVLLVDGDPDFLGNLSEKFIEKGFKVLCCRSAEEAIRTVNRHTVHVCVLEIFLPDRSGMEVLDYIKRSVPHCSVIVLTGQGSVKSAVESLKKGAVDYFTKPADFGELYEAVKRAMDGGERSPEDAGDEIPAFASIVGHSPIMRELFRVIRRVAATDTTVLITGESGTGKELVAKAIHDLSSRHRRPFVPVNCGAIPEELLESEFFGHEKGAFSGAIRTRQGRFELADGGSVFLDEIGEMSPKLQVKLLRFLQDRKFERVGGVRTIEVDVRIIAATNRDLWKSVQEGSFREDLFYRLNVVPIHVPALRERTEDIPHLVRHFIKMHSERKALPAKNVSEEVMECFMRYPWPGNVRELENLIERLLILTEGDVITIKDLPDRFLNHAGDGKGPVKIRLPDSGIHLKKTLESIEIDLIMQALDKAGGVKNHAAKLLRLNRTTLIEKMKKLGISYPPSEVNSVIRTGR
ncbi:sigma-54-dependent transcriptional regulator [Thermodesulforhabdus norvegica]|nr:sigma-54 dependent transcriptional regulator [Thermodesulforhabdus norvegica]